jgi:hypothetical protein
MTGGGYRSAVRQSVGRTSDVPKTLLSLVLLVSLWHPAPVRAQDAVPSAGNPLAALYEEAQQALAAAGVPFSAEQRRAIVLMMEDRRKASEELFGDLMDFRGGPTQGEQADRLRSAIDWMQGEFLRNVAAYLTPDQASAWQTFLATQAATAEDSGSGAAADDQTQFVRIHNNAFTAEDDGFGGGGFTEVISRGGRGAWHGNAQLLVKDAALNARNPFAGNQPPYQERRISADVSGPAIQGRLTTSVNVNSVESENVDTVRATLPDGEYALGITRPHTFRRLGSNSTLQFASSHSMRANVWFTGEAGEDQGIGGFTLPERGYDFESRGGGVNLRQFSILPSASLFEIRAEVERNSSETVPHTHGIRVNVLDAFNGGGAQNRSENRNRTYQLDTMFTRTGDVFTVKTGVESVYRDQHRLSENNFAGTFTFSSLEDYLAGDPINFRMNVGTPSLRTTQFEGAAFVQVDAAVTSRLTLMFGARYDAQSNLDDYNNISPRMSFGYAPGQATVIRGGGGVFYNSISIGMFENQRRFDGTRQFEIILDNPSYPDAFGAGTFRQTFPSIRVTDPGLQAPRLAIGMLSVERTFLSNLLLSVSYNFQREYGRLRSRDLNAPFDTTWPTPRACQPGQPEETCVRPDPTRGQVLNLESTGREVRHNVTIGVRKRFRVLNVSAEYELQHVYSDVQGGYGTLSTDSYDPRADWGRAPFPPHDVRVTANMRLPLDVFVSARMDANTGRHYSITTGLDDNRDGNVNDRPPGLAPNTERGPAFMDFDFNISKAFFFRRSGTGPNVNVFANMTNAFNRVHYGTPSGVLTSPNFGKSTSASNPREIEAGLRFQF